MYDCQENVLICIGRLVFTDARSGCVVLLARLRPFFTPSNFACVIDYLLSVKEGLGLVQMGHVHKNTIVCHRTITRLASTLHALLDVVGPVQLRLSWRKYLVSKV